MFNDIISSSKRPWIKFGQHHWYHTSNKDIKLCRRTGMIYDLYYNNNSNMKVIIGRTKDEAKDKAEDYLKKIKVI